MEKEGKKIGGDSAVEGDYMAPQIPILNDTQETNEAPGTGVNQLHYQTSCDQDASIDASKLRRTEPGTVLNSNVKQPDNQTVNSPFMRMKTNQDRIRGASRGDEGDTARSIMD